MQTRMKLWLAAVVVGCATIAGLALPPSLAWEGRPIPLPEEVRFWSIADSLVLTHGVLVTRGWSDSLSELTVRTAEGGLAVGVPLVDPITTAGVDEWRALIGTRLAELRPRAEAVAVGVFAQPDRHGALPSIPAMPLGMRPQTYVGEREGRPYCLKVHPIRGRIDNARLREMVALRGCRLYAKYGLPGSYIQSWLDAGGTEFALEDRAVPSRRTPPFQGANESPVVGFGFDRPFDETLTGAACLAGRADACEEFVTDPHFARPAEPDLAAAPGSPVSHVEIVLRTPLERQASYFLADVEQAFGPQAFARFWASELPVAAAFQETFDVSLGSWTRDWTGRHVGHFAAGPTPRAGMLLHALLWTGLLAAGAVVIGTRRRVA